MLSIILINCFVVALVVVIHYEILSKLATIIPRLRLKPRFRLIIGVFGALIAHSVEVWIYGLTYYFINSTGTLGHLEGKYDDSLLDSVYFSYTSYTTLGLGDILPVGYIRQMVGLESLVGLLLIAWTASFIYYEMQRTWSKT